MQASDLGNCMRGCRYFQVPICIFLSYFPLHVVLKIMYTAFASLPLHLHPEKTCRFENACHAVLIKTVFTLCSFCCFISSVILYSDHNHPRAANSHPPQFYTAPQPSEQPIYIQAAISAAAIAIPTVFSVHARSHETERLANAQALRTIHPNARRARAIAYVHERPHACKSINMLRANFVLRLLPFLRQPDNEKRVTQPGRYGLMRCVILSHPSFARYAQDAANRKDLQHRPDRICGGTRACRMLVEHGRAVLEDALRPVPRL